jgi:ubiquinone/menaquinone biosynthesis C-methylase UbiE
VDHGSTHDETHHGHAPAVHDDPEHWAKRLDDPARDARQKPHEVVAALAVREGMVVADVGAGTGYFEPHLSRAAGTTGKVLALDIEPKLVAHMQARFAKAGLSNVEARLVAPTDPGLAARTVDRALIVDTWHHMQERVAYAAKLRQALRPAGRVVVVDYLKTAPEGPPPQMRVSPEIVVGELVAAGFDARVVAESLPFQFIVVGEVPP